MHLAVANYPGCTYKDCIFTKEMIDRFIERVSSININLYIEQIKESKKNRKPE